MLCFHHPLTTNLMNDEKVKKLPTTNRSTEEILFLSDQIQLQDLWKR